MLPQAVADALTALRSAVAGFDQRKSTRDKIDAMLASINALEDALNAYAGAVDARIAGLLSEVSDALAVIESRDAALIVAQDEIKRLQALLDGQPDPTPEPIPEPTPGPEPIPEPDAEADWIRRSTGAGVTYAQDFRDPGVTQFFFANQNDAAQLALISRDTTDGVSGGACLKIVTPAGWPNANSATFRHPLSSAWKTNAEHFGAAPFWWQWRMKINAGRLVKSIPGDGWKYFILGQFSLQDGGKTGMSHVDATIVGVDGYQRGFPQAYHYGLNGIIYGYEQAIGSAGEFNFQNALDNGEGLPNAERYCLRSTSQIGFPGCWKWPVDVWFTMMCRVRFGAYNSSGGNEFDQWVALPGATQWTHLHHFTDRGAGTPQDGYGGLNGIHWTIYETGRTGGGEEAVVKYDQIIVSTQDIPLPGEDPVIVVPDPTPTPVAGFTGRLARQENFGSGYVPNYETAHITREGKILSIGHVGIHNFDYPNDVQQFDPDTNTVELLKPWTQDISIDDARPKSPPGLGTGYNTEWTTYDNHPSSYSHRLNTAIWHGHGVFDLNTRKVIRGNRRPQTRNDRTYCTGLDTFWKTYNPAYAPLPERDEMVFYGGQQGDTTLVRWVPSGNPDAPYKAVRWVLEGKGIKGLSYARNNAVGIGNTMFVGGGQCHRRGGIVDSWFTITDDSEDLEDGKMFSMAPGDPAAMPSGMGWWKRYYIRDFDQGKFRISETLDGPPMTVGNFTGTFQHTPNYRLWAIHIANTYDETTVELISSQFPAGQAYPLLTYDSQRKRFVLIGRSVWILDAGNFVETPPANWPVGGFKSVVGGYIESHDAIFFRGTPIDASKKADAWWWNKLSN